MRVSFDEATAELVGRRFSTQVKKIRKAIEAAGENAVAARLAAKAAAETDADAGCDSRKRAGGYR